VRVHAGKKRYLLNESLFYLHTKETLLHWLLEVDAPQPC